METMSKTARTLAAAGLLLSLSVAVAPAAIAAEEDEPGWSCVSDGNRICGPNNAEGKPAACYDDGGVIVALWPCHVVVNRDGSADVYEGLAPDPVTGIVPRCLDICMGA